jgi:hypothetical protein
MYVLHYSTMISTKKSLYVHPKYIWDWELNLGRKELGVSVIRVYIGERFREFYSKHCDGSDFFSI